MFISGLVLGQEKAPFKQFDEANKNEYSTQKKAIVQSKSTALEKINLRLQLASKYKVQDDLIKALEERNQASRRKCTIALSVRRSKWNQSPSGE